jgi:exonuclease SbcC
VAAASNTWLKNLSDHRYEMVANENSGAERGKTSLAISIRDGDSGDLREVNTLSGGEKFQAALAFALGLGSVVTEASAATHLGCLFIDEGFGTLDDNSRAAAVEQLQKLRQGGRRTVGVITHIKEIKDILEIGIEITTEGRGRRRGVSVNQPAIRHYTPEPNWKTLLRVGEAE